MKPRGFDGNVPTETSPSDPTAIPMVWLGGEDRAALSGLALRFARALQAPFVWVNVSDPAVPATEDELKVLGTVPERERVEVVRSTDLAPDDPAANSALWAGERSPTPASRLMEYLRVPSLVRDLVEDRTADDGPVTLVVSNVDRLGNLYPEELASTRRWLRTLAENRVGLVVTHSGGLRTDRLAFDPVLRLDSTEGPDGPQWVVEVERNANGLWDAPEGTRQPLHTLPFPEH